MDNIVVSIEPAFPPDSNGGAAGEHYLYTGVSIEPAFPPDSNDLKATYNLVGGESFNRAGVSARFQQASPLKILIGTSVSIEPAFPPDSNS